MRYGLCCKEYQFGIGGRLDLDNAWLEALVGVIERDDVLDQVSGHIIVLA